MKFMMTSNIFLFLPVIASVWAGEWIYFAFALGLAIFSPLYHYLSDYGFRDSIFFNLVKTLDWLIALGAYGYMYYFIFVKISYSLHAILAILLTFTVIFFWYGFKFGNYRKIHPWFHVIAPIISTLIVLSVSK